MVFQWFGIEQWSIASIVRELNNRHALLRGNKRTRCWTYTIIRHMLANARYIGRWSYGRNKTVIVERRYKRGVPREQPLRTMQIEQLRIIDDVLWAKVQQRLAKYHERAGRKPKDGNRKKNPRGLSRLYTCEVHNVPMTVTGTNGIYQACPVCRREREPSLLSMLHRERAHRMVCQELARVTRSSTELAEQVVAECRAQAEEMQKPDSSALEELERRQRKLDQHIAFVLANPGDTERDRAESSRALQDARARRAQIELEIATLRNQMGHPARVPTVGEVRALMDDLTGVLSRGTTSDQPEDVAAVQDVVTVLTDGVILVSQAGEKRRQRGWLRLKMRSKLLTYLLRQFGVPSDNDGGKELSIDLRRLPKHEEIADQVKDLADRGVPLATIAKNFHVGKGTITKALQHWHVSRGLAPLDYRSLRSRLKQHGLPKYQSIAEEAARLAEEPLLLLEEIAKRFRTSRETVRKAIT